jgi:hypothetical protein
VIHWALGEEAAKNQRLPQLSRIIRMSGYLSSTELSGPLLLEAHLASTVWVVQGPVPITETNRIHSALFGMHVWRHMPRTSKLQTHNARQTDQVAAGRGCTGPRSFIKEQQKNPSMKEKRRPTHWRAKSSLQVSLHASQASTSMWTVAKSIDSGWLDRCRHSSASVSKVQLCSAQNSCQAKHLDRQAGHYKHRQMNRRTDRWIDTQTPSSKTDRRCNPVPWHRHARCSADSR